MISYKLLHILDAILGCWIYIMERKNEVEKRERVKAYVRTTLYYIEISWNRYKDLFMYEGKRSLSFQSYQFGTSPTYTLTSPSNAMCLNIEVGKQKQG